MIHVSYIYIYVIYIHDFTCHVQHGDFYVSDWVLQVSHLVGGNKTKGVLYQVRCSPDELEL